jgi:hypothetical protein
MNIAVIIRKRQQEIGPVKVLLSSLSSVNDAS